MFHIHEKLPNIILKPKVKFYEYKILMLKYLLCNLANNSQISQSL